MRELPRRNSSSLRAADDTDPEGREDDHPPGALDQAHPEDSLEFLQASRERRLA